MVATAIHVLGREPLKLGLVAGVVGLLTQFSVTAFARAQLGVVQSESSRYVYTAAVFLLIAVASWLSGRDLEARRPRVAVTIGLLAAVALASNGVSLLGTRSVFLSRADETKAALFLMTEYGGSPAIPDDRAMWATGAYIPRPDRLREILARYGSPLHDSLVPRNRAIPDAALDTVLFRLVAHALEIGPAGTLPPSPVALSVEAAVNVAVQPSGGCVVLRPTAPDPQLYLVAPGGSALFARADAAGAAQVFLSGRGTYTEEASKRLPANLGAVTRIGLPDLGDDSTWLVRFDPSDDGATRLCAGAPGT